MFRLFFVLFSLFLITPSHGATVPTMVIEQEQLNAGAIPLSGLWAFDWQELHLDSQRPMNDGLMLPGLWHQQGPYNREGYGTFRKRLLLPRVQPYFLKVPDAPSALALWVNGQLLFKRGVVAEVPEFEVPEFGPALVQLPAADHYDLVLHVSNHHHKEGGMWHQLKIADHDHKHMLVAQSKMLDAMLFTFLLSVSLYMLVTHWQRKKRTPVILFVVFLWAIGLRSVLVGERIAYDFMSVSWHTQQQLEHGLLWLALPLFIYYFHSFFQLNRFQILRVLAHVVSLISVVMLAIILLTETKVFAYTGQVFQVLASVFAMYCFAMLVMLTFRKTVHSRQFLMSFCGFFLLFLHDILYTNLLIQSRPMAQFGLLFFVMMQSHMLWRSRMKESHLLRYVRRAIDYRTDNIKTLVTQAQKQKEYLHEEVFPCEGISSELMTKLNGLIQLSEEKVAFPLNDLKTSVKPYFEILNCQLEFKQRPRAFSGATMLWVQKQWLEHVILCLGRLGEQHGHSAKLVLSELDSAFLVRLSINGVKPNVSLNDELINWLMQILNQMQCALCIKRGKKSAHLYFKLPHQGYCAEVQTDIRDTRSGKTDVRVCGIESEHRILIQSDKPDIYEASLAKHFALIFGAASVEHLNRYRPLLVVLEVDARSSAEEVERLKGHYPQLPVIIVLAGHLKMELAQWIRKGVTDYMVAPLITEELVLKVQQHIALGQRHVHHLAADTVDETASLRPVDLRELTVQLVRTCIQYWQSYTGQSKAALAESSRLWRVYVDGSTAKTRTLDKYLSLNSLPKNPRWDTVTRTAMFVMERCELSEVDRNALDAQLKRLHEALAA